MTLEQLWDTYGDDWVRHRYAFADRNFWHHIEHGSSTGSGMQGLMDGYEQYKAEKELEAVRRENEEVQKRQAEQHARQQAEQQAEAKRAAEEQARILAKQQERTRQQRQFKASTESGNLQSGGDAPTVITGKANSPTTNSDLSIGRGGNRRRGSSLSSVLGLF